MSSASILPDERSVFWQSFDDFCAAIEKKKSSEKPSKEMVAQARALAQTYFRVVRPELQTLISNEDLQPLDQQFQTLLTLANQQSTVGRYKELIPIIRSLRPTIEVKVEFAVSAKLSRTGFFGVTLSALEEAILETLDRLVPTAAASYRQALSDLRDLKRQSFRGCASELRECVREVLDHLAPDDDVGKSPGFKLESNATKPTMKQKARFILRARKVAEGARSVPENMVEVIEESVAALPRLVYSQGSLSTHVSQTRAQVRQLKTYTDAVLSELLQLNS